MGGSLDPERIWMPHVWVVLSQQGPAHYGGVIRTMGGYVWITADFSELSEEQYPGMPLLCLAC
eukprot:15435-Heterococcus_DN1.PRE.1